MAGKPNPPKEYARETIGRPSKFTPERCSSIIDAISHRIPYEMAAEANGISGSTLYEWLKTGNDQRNLGMETEYTIFSEALKRAEMQKVREHTDMIAAKPERWQADAWLLERRWYKYFGPNAQLNDLNNRLSKMENGESGDENSSNEENSKEG